MRVNRFLTKLYRDTYHKYHKYKRRLDKSLRSGQFYRYTSKKQKELVGRIERLRRRLQNLSLQLKIAGAGLAFSLLLDTSTAVAQSSIGPFTERPLENPMRPPLETGQFSAPYLVDFDTDGDLDLFVGTNYSKVLYFKNIGSATAPHYKQIQNGDPEDPFENITWPTYSEHLSLVMMDISGDIALDMVIAESRGSLIYFENVGGKFQEKTGSENPFDGFSLVLSGGTPYPNLALADIDGNGDTDIYAGVIDNYGYLFEIINNGDGTFGAPHRSSDSFPIPGPFVSYAAPSFIDYDKDGDLDMVLGEYNGNLRYYQNREIETGSITFLELTGASNPFDGISVYNHSNPVFADVDGDTHPDLILGMEYGTYPTNFFEPIRFYKNDGAGNFDRKSDLESPFDGVFVHNHANGSLGDIDGDGDLDLIMTGDINIFSFYTSIYLYKDISQGVGTVQFKNETALLGVTAPFGSQNAPTYSNVILADIDLDGDLDLIIADSGSPERFLYFENNGGTFTEKLGSDNPFDGIYFGSYNISVGFGDLDGDGDLDALFSTQNFLYYYEDIGAPGTPHVPNYQLSTLNGDLTSTDFFGYRGIPRILDLDHDGDLDVVYGKYQEVVFFENTGTGSSPNLSQAPGPFDFISNNTENAVSILDVDRDGDLDMLVGEKNGRLRYYKNENPPAQTSFAASQVDFQYQTGAAIVDANLTLSDADADLILQATVSIQGFESGKEALSFTPQGGITGSFDTATGVLTLVGQSTLANYQSVLRSITYEFTGAKPPTIKKGDTGGRTIIVNKSISFEVLDADFTTPAIQSIPLQITFANEAPVLASTAGPITFITTPITVDGTLVVTDNDDADLDGATVRITPSSFVNGEDQLLFTNQNGISGSYSSTTGVLTLTGTTTSANYQAALRTVQYNDSSGTPSSTGRTIEFFVDDGEDVSNITSVNVVIGVNQAPILSSSTSSISFTGSALVVDGAITVSDADDTNLESATVLITPGTLISGEDNLTFTNQNGITGSYNSSSGVLTLSGTSSVANYQTALRSIQYSNSSGTPNTTTRAIQFTVNDGTISSNTISVSVLINLGSGTPPVFSVTSVSVNAGGTATIPLTPLISDVDGDADLTTLTIIQNPTSGAPASINASDELVVDFSSGTFAGSETVILQVCDLAGNCTQQTMTITVTNSAPTSNASQQSATFNGQVTLDLSTVFTDAEDNIDPTSYQIITNPSSAAVASITGTMLTVNYSGTNFVGTDMLTVQVCDLVGDCSQVTISIVIGNAAPAISVQPQTTTINGTVSIDLSGSISDPDGNLDPASFKIITPPISNAPASITGGILTIDYSNSDFAGMDILRIEACDLAGECTQADISISVEGNIIVNNGISPNGDGKNDKWIIENINTLGPENTVNLFSRWGDQVFSAKNYNNTTVVFEGLNNNGKEVASGVYFYRIEFDNNRKSLTGYLTIKR